MRERNIDSQTGLFQYIPQKALFAGV